ncbi:MAG TPA: TonB-dependent receptor [Bacteroidales bacterium]|nr:TonB-dependent receptor [Bacteroidales bacterium]
MKKILMMFVLALATTALTLGQTVHIRGTVTSSEDGLGMPGVMISVKGTTLGTMSDNDGKYAIDVPQNAKLLTFSYVGMKTQEIDITGKTVVDVVMQPDLQMMDEVVVVGYGVQKKRDVTGAIGSVKGDQIASLATPSFDAQLAGRTAGVQINTQSGILGETPRMRIRGVGSISQGTYPLVVVDGIPVFVGDQGGEASTNALGDINPADIESMEILKDGSATAIYGSRAANGVILITTKKGSKNQGKYSLTYNTYFGVASPIKKFDLLNADEFIEIQNEKRVNADEALIAETGTAHPKVNTDWQKAVLRSNAFQMDHNLSLSGANEKTSYYFSMGYTSQEGIAKPNSMNRFTIRANVDQNIKKWLKLGVNVGASKTTYSGLNTGTNSLSGNVFNAIRQAPNAPIYDSSTPTGYNIDSEYSQRVGRWNNAKTLDDNITNIVYVIDHNRYNSKVNRLMASTYAQVNFTPDLYYKAILSVDQSQTDGLLYWNPVHGDGASSGGIIEQTFQNDTRWNVQNILGYNKTLADVHNIGITLINEYQSTNSYSMYADGYGLSDVFFNKNMITSTMGTMECGGGMADNGFISYAARANYNYAGKYYLQGSIRYDGISALPKENKYGLFPGASVGWTISKENFFAPLTSVVNDMKIRASYAQVGNTSLASSYLYQALFAPTKYAAYNGIIYNQAPNAELKWEKSTKYDVGFDVQFLDSRFGLTFDYYYNKIENMILARPYPNSLGIPYNQIYENIGSMKNTGYEVSANAFVVRKSDFTWQIDANITFAQNEILTLTNHADMFGPGGTTGTYYINREGKSIYSLYGYKYWGVNKANGNAVYYKADGSLVQLNAYSGVTSVFDKANPTNEATAASLVAGDQRIVGSSLPKYYGGLNTKVTYKDFDLSLFFRFSGGNKIMNRTRCDNWSLNFVNNTKEILGRWQSAEEPGNGWVPRLIYGEHNYLLRTGYTNTMFVEKGNFVKLSNVVLGYTLPKDVASRIGVENLRIYVQGQELLTFTKYKGIDPEMETNGYDFNGTPRQKVISAGISLTL